MKAPNAYPLAWPAGLPRTAHRTRATFRVSMARAVEDALDSLRLFGKDTGGSITGLVISSNVTLGVSRPHDPGVAFYFRWDGAGRCIAVDKYDRPEDNLRAIFHIIEARRVELRHGGIGIVRAAFKGFAALPPGSAEDWREVLGVGPGADLSEAETAFRRAARSAHPDLGGSTDEMARLNAAIAAARAELRGRAA